MSMSWLKSFWLSLFAPKPGDPATNFSLRSRQVLALAREEAKRLNHSFVGTEHVLLGLIALGQGMAINVLTKMGLQQDTVRLEVEEFDSSAPLISARSTFFSDCFAKATLLPRGC